MYAIRCSHALVKLWTASLKRMNNAFRVGDAVRIQVAATRNESLVTYSAAPDRWSQREWYPVTFRLVSNFVYQRWPTVLCECVSCLRCLCDKVFEQPPQRRADRSSQKPADSGVENPFCWNRVRKGTSAQRTVFWRGWHHYRRSAATPGRNAGPGKSAVVATACCGLNFIPQTGSRTNDGWRSIAASSSMF